MAFDLEVVKTKLADWLHTLETDLGSAVKPLEDGFHAVLHQVHNQVRAEEEQNVAAGAVTTAETPAAASTGETKDKSKK